MNIKIIVLLGTNTKNTSHTYLCEVGLCTHNITCDYKGLSALVPEPGSNPSALKPGFHQPAFNPVTVDPLTDVG